MGMVRDITLGQYFSAKSVLHNMDARIKIVLSLAIIVFIFLCKTFLALAITAVFTLGLILLSRVPMKMVFKSIKPLTIIILFTAILNIFYNTGGRVLVQFWRITISYDGIFLAIFMAIRIICLVIVGSLLTYTTTPTMLTDALERLLSPLKIFKIRVHTMAMMMSLALRFIPVLIEEIDRIMNAQKARGADLESGGIISRAKALVPIFIPLLISAFRRAYELAFAMECRCYTGGEGRTRMKQMRLTYRDAIAAIIVCCYLAAILLCNHFFTAVI